ncbi:MAG: flippase-like domain-containing protein, partial [Bacteroidetes bacterium]|nr:flippase-like domain-containing protein [Bacteroidota bacterium]
MTVNKGIQAVLKVLFFVVTAAGLIYLFRDVNSSALMATISSSGSIVFIISAVYGVGSLSDTLAWKFLLPTQRSVPFLTLLQIHIAGESYYRFLPAGAIVGESVKVFLLKRHTSAETSEILTSLFLRKLLMGFAQVFYLGVAVVIGIMMKTGSSVKMFESIAMTVALMLLILFVLFGYAVTQGNFCRTILSLLFRIPHHRFTDAVKEYEHHFLAADRMLSTFFVSHRVSGAVSFLFFTFGWLTELAETILVIAFLGVSITIPQSMLFEPVVSLLRSVAFILPAGLGVMDAGYV